MVAVLLGVLAPAAAAQDAEGYTVAGREAPAPGVTHVTLIRSDPAQVVHVARFRTGGEYVLRTMLSSDTVTGRSSLERTSSMCRRIRCVVAVNGDFAQTDDGAPVGGLVSLGEVVRTPTHAHHQLFVSSEGGMSTGPAFSWTGRILSTDLQETRIDGVNVPRGQDGIVMYTARHGATTGTNPFGAELVVRFVKPGGPPRVGQTSVARVEALHWNAGDTPIPRDGAVLSGHGAGAAALGDLWTRAERGVAGREVLVRFETEPAVSDTTGGSPILVRDGRPWFTDAPTPFVRGRHPRTVAGWNADGDVLLVTVDGRQPGRAEGMTLAETADLMIALGATEAINLDGGGSTTFVVGGEVRNRPSDRLVRTSSGRRISHTAAGGVVGYVERPVTTALVLVPRTVSPAPAAAPSAVDLDVPQALAVLVPTSGDPASDPTATHPVVVAAVATSDRPVPLAAALVALAGALAAAGRFVDRRAAAPAA